MAAVAAKLQRAVPQRSSAPSSRRPAPQTSRPRIVANPASPLAQRASAMLSPLLQASSKVSSPNDAAEREADAVARRVVSLPAPATAMIASAAGTVQRKALARPAPRAASTPPAGLRGGHGAGTMLGAPLRRFMEPRFGADFSGVRLHTDERAATLSRSLSAQAFTSGSHIFFGKNQFQPETPGGRELIAHELTHTIQQGAAIQRKALVPVTQVAPPQIQRGVLDRVGAALSDAADAVADVLPNPLDWLAEKANGIPGFPTLTIVLGVNPINMSPVQGSAADVFDAIIEYIPGASSIRQALTEHKIFAKIAGWAKQQLDSLGDIASSIKDAITAFVDVLDLKRILTEPGAVWESAKSIFSTPWEKIKNFVAGLAADILQLIKDAILRPLGKLAEGTRAYDLLKAILGEDPVTGDAADSGPEAIVGGLMTLAGQGDIWARVQESKAIPRVVSWFNGVVGKLKGFVTQIPGLFMTLLTSLTIMDVVTLVGAFQKVATVFGGFVQNFISWALDAGWKLLEIAFDVVSPGAWGYVQRTGAALKSILKNPLPFVGNLAKAAKAGFQNFAGRFTTHLKNGLIDWLTGSLSGVYIPKALSLGEIVKFVFSVLGLTWQNLRGKLVKAVGEPAVAALEKGFAIVKTLVTKGPAAAWEQIKGELSALKDQVIEGIKGLVIEAVVTKAIPKFIAMFIPGAGFISAIISIYDIVMVFVQKIAKIVQVVNAFVSSIVAIAAGNIGAAASKVESVLAGLLTLAINFLAGFAGLGKIANKINGIIQKIRAPIDKALDSMVAWIKRMAKKFLDALGGKDASPEEKQKRLDQGSAAALAAVSKYSGKAVGDVILKPLLAVVKLRYRLTALEPVKQGEVWAIRAEINPVKITKTSVKAGKTSAEVEIGYESHWPLDEFMSKAGAIKSAAEGKTANQAMTLGFEKGSKTKRKSTKELRQGGQEAFRAEIHGYIDSIPVAADQSAARGLMSQLQADHQQELQMGGTDTAENMAMIESRMNSQMGAMFRGQLKDLPAETKINKVNIETKAGTAKSAKHRKSGSALALQTLLLKHAKKLGTAAATIKAWFKLE